MNDPVLVTLKYFAFFDYQPTFEELHTFLERKISAQALQKSLKNLIKKKRLSEKAGRYTLGEYRIAQRRALERRIRLSRQKVERIRLFLKLIGLLPQVSLVGLSGSVAMQNAAKSDDIDLFVIARRKRLWTARMICLLAASLFGRRRFNDPHTSDKLCLNLFFDEAKMSVPVAKRSHYVAHEVLQMKPLISRGGVFERYLEANKWVFSLFPNSKSHLSRSTRNFLNSVTQFDGEAIASSRKKFMYSRQTLIGNLVERILKSFQMAIIKKHRTTEMITANQLWFFPDDFGKKIS